MDRSQSLEENKQEFDKEPAAAEEKQQEQHKSIVIAFCSGLCPPQGEFGNVLTNVFLMMTACGMSLIIFDGDILLGGNVYILLLIVSISYVSGQLANIFCLPDVFGMVISGIALRTFEGFQLRRLLDAKWCAVLRCVVLPLLFLQAGMEMNLKGLKRFSFIAAMLAIAPCIVEVGCSSLASRFFLDMQWGYALMLGGIMAETSPVVVLICLMNLSIQGYGVEKDIPTLVIATSTVNNIIADFFLNIFSYLNFPKESMASFFLNIPKEIAIGTMFAVVCGIALWYLPPPRNAHKNILRSLILLNCAIGGYIFSVKYFLGKVGVLAATLLGFTVQMSWRKEVAKGELKNSPVFSSLCLACNVSKYIMFGLIGTEVDFSRVDFTFLGWCLMVLSISILSRVAMTCAILCCSSLSIKEKIFVAVSLLSKANVQMLVRISLLAHMLTREITKEDQRHMNRIHEMTIFSTLVTVPLEVAFYLNLGPTLLQRDLQPDPPEDSSQSVVQVRSVPQKQSSEMENVAV